MQRAKVWIEGIHDGVKDAAIDTHPNHGKQSTYHASRNKERPEADQPDRSGGPEHGAPMCPNVRHHINSWRSESTC